MPPLKLPSRLLHDQANACLALWVAQLPGHLPPSVGLDASELTEFDSSALAVLLTVTELLPRLPLTVGLKP